ncbi:hypothetical protein PTSG_07235 [Salpingoeca rosetta]|uniref:Signal recognition particle subunit SRP68 n=1 Tax=Salpingoeca rosetta (strain ATCC 50818 / BSB-021) TaxID=946362 RepID=F2UEG1_SALR5|nr:uncharacterized protein PTSG_07235 [Salpingoeca rosetta]EGD75011.1 hypothetical protein PTSG_07235 [Salpingoeca rosetta]|eukprot:XP_004992655.1 hypothetical protein PTSG_07235 [Salpingoeca rosetta]
MTANEEEQQQQQQEEQQAPKEPQQFKLLPFVVGLQRQHGLRHGDFQRYRKFCTRRMHRVRKNLKFTQGKRKFVQTRVGLKQVQKAVNFLEIPVLSAERAWAYFREDKQLSKQETRKLHHAGRRLRKAITWADEVVRLVSKSKAFDSLTALEAQAYADWLHALTAFESKQWKDAESLFSRAKQTYTQLLKLAASDEEEKIYERKVQELDASARYCLYNLEGTGDIKSLLELRSALDTDEMDLLSDQLDSALTAKRQEDGNTIKELEWLDRTVPLKSSRLRAQITAVHAKADDIKQLPSDEDEKTMMAAYDALLMAFGDALATTDDLADEELKAAGGLTSDAIKENLAQLQFVRAYLEFHRLQHTLDRNLAMISRCMRAYTGEDDGSRPEDIVRLFDLAAQSLDEMLEVEFAEEDDAFVARADAYKPYFRAMRCFYIAESFRLLGKLREALAMFDRASEVAAVARTKLQAQPAEFAEPLLAALDSVQVRMRAVRVGMQAGAFLQASRRQEDESAARTDEEGAVPDDDADRLADVPLSETINTLDTSAAVLKRPLLQFPPEFQAMSCKPLFFDMGSSHLAFPNVGDRTQSQTEATVSAVTSMFSSWWGGNKSDA